MRRAQDSSRSLAAAAISDVSRRELGDLSPRNFARRLAGSEDIILRFQISKTLRKHEGCVNAINFNSDGDILLSGSDDKQAILWDWQAGKAKLSFHTGHLNNVFQAKFMPYSDDQTIVTSSADGQVRLAQILEGGAVQTLMLTKHQGRVHKIAIEPGSPHVLYTCGEDGLVQHLDLRSKGARGLFTCRSARKRSIVHLNAVAIDPRNPNLFAIGGSDEYARLYDIRRYRWDGSSDFSKPIDYFCPMNLLGSGDIGITGLAFSHQSELLVSYYNEWIYLFDRSMGLGSDPHSEKTKSEAEMESDKTDDMPQVYVGHSNFNTVKGVAFFGPRCEYVMSGSDCGRAFIWDRSGKLLRVMEADVNVVNCIEPHPHSAILASSGIEYDIKVWTPDASEKAGLPPDVTEIEAFDMPLDYSSEDDEDDDYSDEFVIDEDEDNDGDEVEDDCSCFSFDDIDDEDVDDIDLDSDDID